MRPTNALTEKSPGRDTTERLRSRIAELEKERADTDGFAAIAAHELLEPLIMIEAHATAIGDRLKDTAGAEAEQVEDLGRAASRLRHLVEIILHDARSGAEVLRRETVDLHAVAIEVVALHSQRIRVQRVSVEVADLPSVTGDFTLLASVMSNLLANAIKYGPPSDGRIEIRAEQVPAGWRVIIGDDGPRIHETERARIFEAYERGAGLGLAICKRIVERHGGEIGVAAGERGNDFYFTLPN